jgi:hypothetical protein
MLSRLRLSWCNYAAAKFAVENWHYSKRMPASKLAKIGVWEDGQFIGVIIFGVGANSNAMKPYGLKAHEGCELVRVALREHKAPVSKMMAIAVRMIRKKYKRLRLIVSYADPGEGHHGGIYQATNWIYAGQGKGDRYPVLDGRVMHPRTLSKRIEYGHKIDRKKVFHIKKVGKHRYLLPLDEEIKKQIQGLARPYPKRGRSIDGDAPTHPVGEGGSTPDPSAPVIERPAPLEGATDETRETDEIQFRDGVEDLERDQGRQPARSRCGRSGRASRHGQSLASRSKEEGGSKRRARYVR